MSLEEISRDQKEKSHEIRGVEPKEWCQPNGRRLIVNGPCAAGRTVGLASVVRHDQRDEEDP